MYGEHKIVFSLMRLFVRSERPKTTAGMKDQRLKIYTDRLESSGRV